MLPAHCAAAFIHAVICRTAIAKAALILWPMPDHTLSEILRSRKRHTARQANIILGRTGEMFWQHESYDHWIRSDEEKSRIRRYIRNNPVKAGVCGTPEEWRWGSAHL